MKKITALTFAILLFAGLSIRALAGEETLTITGNMECGKCVLHETKTCQNVVQVMNGTNTVNYYLKENDVSKAAHEPICGGSSEKVTVTGTVKTKDGKEMMTPTKIDVDKS
jgi:hypothetical protein